jgi:hypothetical protein
MADLITKKAPRERTKRTPIAQRNILTVEGRDPEYTYRIVNDTGDRIQAFKDAGYEMVLAKDVRVGDKRVNSATPEGSNAQVSVGAGQKAFVMRIPQEWYEEDQLAKQARITVLEQTMKTEALSQNTLRNGKLELTRE